MAWIQFHEDLLGHYKVHDFCRIYGCDLDTALGKLARFWCWCTKYAQNGDLRKHNDERLGGAVGLNGEDAKRFVEAMLQSRWIEREPYFRVHDWWDHTKEFWKSRYKQTPDKWLPIETAYRTGQVPVLDHDREEDEEERREEDGTKDFCVAPRDGAPPEPSVPEVLKGLTLYEKDRRLAGKIDELLPAWQAAYPGVDLRREIAKAHAWEVANADRRKTNRRRFLTNWLSKAQDGARGGSRGSYQAGHATAKPGKY